MILRFRDGKFRLEEVTRGVLPYLLKNRSYWACLTPELYETKTLRAAAHFRSIADETVEKIFKRTFQTHYELPWLPPLPELDPHQLEGLRWVLSRKRSYLAHAPGAGKTAQAILASCLSKGEGTTLFIVPPSLIINWVREIEKVTAWIGRFPTIGVVPTSNKQETMAWRADFIVCPDSMLATPWVYNSLRALKKKFIAVDEASRFKEPTADRALAFYGGIHGDKAYPGLFRDARHVVFLDGSPMPNRPMELWAPIYALHPEAIDCMERDDFGYRYCGAKPNSRGVWEYLHSSNEAELQAKITKDFMHVVTEDRLSHPERLRSMHFLTKDVRSSEQKTWERTHLSRINLKDLSDDAGQGEMARFRRELGLRKVPHIAAYVSERLRDKNESILLFAWHREVCTSLMDALIEFNPGVIIGGVNAETREHVFAQFQAGTRKLIIGNISAMGRGHNLQAASRVIFGEFSWTDELNKQCEKRASRRGNDSFSTRCEYIVSPGSMDEVVLSSLFTKQKRVEKIIG